MFENTIEKEIEFTLVQGESRSEFLPAYFGMNLMIVGENVVYQFADLLADKYNGGIWKFYNLSNGGFYMALDNDENIEISVNGNFFSNDMSSDAASIVINMFALSYLYSNHPKCTYLIENYYKLKEFASQHKEAQLILAAID